MIRFYFEILKNKSRLVAGIRKDRGGFVKALRPPGAFCLTEEHH